MNKLSLRFFVLLAALALVMAACGGSGTSAQVTPTQTMMMMHLPAYAQNMKVHITSPATGTKVTDNDVTLQVQASGYTPIWDAWSASSVKVVGRSKRAEGTRLWVLSAV
jgi:ABC-type glycerol-3-phosphate transport system substrate-binding protein